MTVDGWKHTRTAQWKLRFSPYGSSISFIEKTAGENNQKRSVLGVIIFTNRCSCVRLDEQPLGDGYSNIPTTRIRTRHTILLPSEFQQGQSFTAFMSKPVLRWNHAVSSLFYLPAFLFLHVISEYAKMIPYQYVLVDEDSQVSDADLFPLFNSNAHMSHPCEQDGRSFCFLETLIRSLRIHKHRGHDTITMRTSRRSLNLWHEHIPHMASTKYLRYNWTPSIVWSLTYVLLPTWCHIGVFAHVSWNPTESGWGTLHLELVLLR